MLKSPNPNISDLDLKFMSQVPLRKILTIEFDAVYKVGNRYIFMVGGEPFCSIPQSFFTSKQISLFESIKLENFTYEPSQNLRS